MLFFRDMLACEFNLNLLLHLAGSSVRRITEAATFAGWLLFPVLHKASAGYKHLYGGVPYHGRHIPSGSRYHSQPISIKGTGRNCERPTSLYDFPIGHSPLRTEHFIYPFCSSSALFILSTHATELVCSPIHRSIFGRSL